VPPSSIRRVAFLGTPNVAAIVLEALCESPIEIVHVVSRPDARRGRGKAVTVSPVKAIAVERGIPVASDPNSLASLAHSGAVDLAVVVAYGRLIRRPLLEVLPMVNLHFSMLPRWRGAAPVERAILAGDTETGVCIMEVAEGLDEGGIYAHQQVPIGDDESATDLRLRLAGHGASLMVSALTNGLESPEPQVGEVTYAHKLDADDFKLELSSSSDQIVRQVRVGRAWCTFRSKRLGVIAARKVDRPAEAKAGEVGTIDRNIVSVGDGAIELVVVKPEGKREMDALSWLNGVQPSTDERLT